MLPKDYRLIRPIYNGPNLYFAVALPGFRTTSCISPLCDVLKTEIGLSEIEKLVRKMGKQDGIGSFEEGFKQFVISTLGKTPAEICSDRPTVKQSIIQKRADQEFYKPDKKEASMKWLENLQPNRPTKETGKEEKDPGTSSDTKSAGKKTKKEH